MSHSLTLRPVFGRLRDLAFALCVLLAGLVAATEVRAVSPLNLLLAEIDARIAAEDAMIAYGEMRATERMNELRHWISWWESVNQVVTDKQQELEKNFQYRQRNASSALALIRSITDTPTEQRELPGFGWMSVERATALTASIALEASRFRELVSEGRDNWMIVTIGWITSGGVQARIDGLIEELEKIDAGRNDGSYSFIFDGHQWTSIGRHRRRAEELRDERARIVARFAAGEYALHIPGIGHLNRQQLEARIDQIEARIDALHKRHAANELPIHRPALGGTRTRKVLVREIDEAEEGLRLARALISDGLFTVHLAGLLTGTYKRQDVEQRIERLDATITNVTELIRTGDYVATVRSGRHSLNGLKRLLETVERRLADPNLTDVQRNQLLEQMDRIRKSFDEWSQISAYDLMIKGVELTSLTGLLPQFMKLARPDIEQRELRQRERLDHMTSFDLEYGMRLRELQERLAVHREAMKWFAGN